ncbi:MAG: glycosyltransferase family 4 protein [Bacteroidota bacterium]
MKILFPAGSFYPAQNGGPDNTVYWITKALTRQGHEAIISTTDWGLADDIPRNTWLKTNYGEIAYSNYTFQYLAWKTILRSLRRIKEVELIHLAMVFYPASWIIALLNSWFYRKPMLWSSHGDLDPPMLKRSRWIKGPVRWLINNFVDKELLWFHSTCEAETQYIKDNFGQDARIIQIINYMELPEPMNVPKEKYFLYIGRIDPKKAIENLISALDRSSLFRKGEFTLRIVGDYNNPYGQRLVEQVKAAGLEDKVHFLGHREGREKEELLAAAWFAFMPSHTENHGIVVMEAMAQGTPAVASTGTPWKILDDCNAGYWVDNDPTTLAEVIDRIHLLSSEQLREMNGNAREVVEKHYSIYSKIGEWEEAYRTVARVKSAEVPV